MVFDGSGNLQFAVNNRARFTVFPAMTHLPLRIRSMSAGKTVAVLTLFYGVGLTVPAVAQRPDTLVNMKTAEVKRCLGAPDGKKVNDDREIWSYLRSAPALPDGTQIAYNAAAAQSNVHPRIDTVAFATPPQEMPAPTHSCLLHLRIDDGRVREVRYLVRGGQNRQDPRCANIVPECASSSAGP